MEVPREELYLKWLGLRNNQKKKVEWHKMWRFFLNMKAGRSL